MALTSLGCGHVSHTPGQSQMEDPQEKAAKARENGTERPKGEGSRRKEFGYQGQRWSCGTAECNVCMVSDVEQEVGVDAVSTLREERCIVGGVMEITKGERWQA